ncbi:MAG TPA: response regulator [Dongiaceae bacterium]|jgi:CheY-like chemotaxis protein
MLKDWMDQNAVAADVAERPMVLVVDDDRNFCEAIARCLAQRGYDVTCADGGEVAVEAIGERKPDVIVTDILMPGMDGIDLMNWLRDEGLDIPVIVISGDGDTAFQPAGNTTKAIANGIDIGGGEKTRGTQGALLAFSHGDSATQTTRDTAAWMGAASVLQKPFGRALLEDSVARALKSHVTVH